ncbi:hypothetical protein UFOVP795_5 [uncultured Caudovirales phage]|uniref:Uncharacterized protein n=1 Tax=uncultured Caudovirales phage TaxID=2100421 RepID=A0A6J5NU92_9CAUD|nr:hypothetical protein UFOVP795_5 [uncultured Caudovirales phage]
MSKVTMEIEGVQKTLAELNKYDKVYRREVTKRIKGAGQEIITTARELIGTTPPLSGMARGKLIKGREVYWDNKTAKAGLKIKVGRRASRGGTVQFQDKFDAENNPRESHNVTFAARPYQLMVAQQTDAAGAIYDHAGAKTKNTNFVNNLNLEIGTQPRAIDPAVEKHRYTVQYAVKEIVDEVAKLLNKKLKMRYGN